MANFRNTADYLDSILLLAGETTNGNSAFETRALHYLNQIHTAIISGGTEFNTNVNELWNWALEDTPILLELQPKYEEGTIALTEGSVTGAFSSAPTFSLKGYHFRLKDNVSKEVYKIESHVAGNTAFTINSLYPGTTEAGVTYTAFKLDYELIPDVIVIDEYNNKITFTEATAGTELVATLTTGSYTIANLLTELDTQLDAVGASTYTSTYNSVTRTFTLTSDLSGADNIFTITGSTGTDAINYASALPTLGFGIQDYSGAGSYISARALGSISKLSEPMYIHLGYTEYNEIYGVDKLRFSKDYPLSQLPEGSPTRFTVLEERADGYRKIRFNRFPKEVVRAEVNYIPTPLALYDTTNSHPIIPPKFSRVLDYGGAAYLMAEKNDNRAQNYFTLAGQLLEAMMLDNRKTGESVGLNYGEIIARADLLPHLRRRRRRLNYGYTSY